MGWNSRLEKRSIFQVDGAGHRENQDWDYGVDRGCGFWRRWAVNVPGQRRLKTSASQLTSLIPSTAFELSDHTSPTSFNCINAWIMTILTLIGSGYT